MIGSHCHGFLAFYLKMVFYSLQPLLIHLCLFTFCHAVLIFIHPGIVFQGSHRAQFLRNKCRDGPYFIVGMCWAIGRHSGHFKAVFDGPESFPGIHYTGMFIKLGRMGAVDAVGDFVNTFLSADSKLASK